MKPPYQAKQPGDILRLPESLPYYEFVVEAGGYVLLSVGDLCCLAALTIDAQGRFRASTRLVDVEMADLSCFEATGMRVDPVG